MIVEPGTINGLYTLTPKVLRDVRGTFMEGWHRERCLQAGLPEFVQFNVSVSKKNVLRGLHGQNPRPQGKLVMVLSGAIWDVAVDIRPGSPTYGQWQSIVLNEENCRQFFIPAGCLHGFTVLSESATVCYLTSDHYDPAGDFAVKWDDPELGVEWPILDDPILSPRDEVAPLLSELDPARFVPFG